MEMDNTLLTIVTLAILAAHLGVVAAWATRGRRMGPILGLNVAAALAILALLCAHPQAFAYGIDWQVVGLAGFEFAVLVAAALAWRGVRAGEAASWAAFALHLSASMGAVAFALLFRMDRLI